MAATEREIILTTVTDRNKIKLVNSLLFLDAFLLDKAIYEIGYELNNRPDWISVPIQGVLQMLAAQA